MSKSADKDAKDKRAVEPLDAIDVVDGVPDRSVHSPPWAYLLLATVFLAWLAFLAYCHLAGTVVDVTGHSH